MPVWKAFPVMPWMRSTEVRFGEGCAIRRNAGPFQMHVASGSWFRGSTSGWAACCHVDHGRFTLKADIATLPRYVRSVPCVDGSELARLFFTFAGWSVQPCVRPVRAVHMTAGHNALRGSGPGQNRAFKDAVALVGCPDRRIDRLCITCYSPSQPSHHTGSPA